MNVGDGIAVFHDMIRSEAILKEKELQSPYKTQNIGKKNETTQKKLIRCEEIFYARDMEKAD